MQETHSRPLAAKGSKLTIEYAIRANGTVEAREFIAALDQESNKKDRILGPGLLALFQRMADHGVIYDEDKFRHLKPSEIYEFKKGRARVLCFHDSRAWVLTHGYFKGAQKAPQTHIDRAEQIMKEDLARRATKNPSAEKSHDKG